MNLSNGIINEIDPQVRKEKRELKREKPRNKDLKKKGLKGCQRRAQGGTIKVDKNNIMKSNQQ